MCKNVKCFGVMGIFTLLMLISSSPVAAFDLWGLFGGDVKGESTTKTESKTVNYEKKVENKTTNYDALIEEKLKHLIRVKKISQNQAKALQPKLKELQLRREAVNKMETEINSYLKRYNISPTLFGTLITGPTPITRCGAITEPKATPSVSITPRPTESNTHDSVRK